VSAWFGLVAPAKTPASALKRLATELDGILKMPDIRKRFSELGAEPGNVMGDAFGDFLAGETATWAKVIQASGVSMN
jgi:tripartite-type tricarboxylate transporter receptor subunit TctC